MADKEETTAQEPVEAVEAPQEPEKPKARRKAEPERTGYQGGSLAEYLASIGTSTSMATRRTLAALHGVEDYTGGMEQDSALLKELRGW